MTDSHYKKIIHYFYAKKLYMPTRDDAFRLLQHYVKSEKMIIHSLCSEAVMIALAERLNEDPLKWGLAGLLHDIDVEITNADPAIHGQKAIEILEDKGYDHEMIEAISTHNECSSPRQRQTILEHALAAGETITGLIYATALVYPEKKLEPVKVKSVTKRMKEKLFAASVKRENIMECEKLGLTLDEFAAISLDAMKKISDKIGL